MSTEPQNSTISSMMVSSSASSGNRTTTCSCSIEVITPILMATVSVIVDGIYFRPDLVKDRLLCQLLLWLVSSLQIATTSTTNSDDDEHIIFLLILQLMNFVFFCSVVSIVYRIWNIKNRWKRQRRQQYPIKTTATTTATGLDRYHHSSIQEGRWGDVSRYLAPCAWICLLYNSSTLCIFHHYHHKNDENDNDNWTLHKQYQDTAILFAVCFCFQWIIHKHFERQEQVKQSLVGLPTISTTATTTTTQVDPTMIDESRWYEWSPYQVLNWISFTLHDNQNPTNQNHTFTNNSLAVQESSSSFGTTATSAMICDMLVTEQISGLALEGLTVDDLRSMGIPYGPARCLEDTIQTRLVDRYPHNNSINRRRNNYFRNDMGSSSNNNINSYYDRSHDDPYWEIDDYPQRQRQFNLPQSEVQTELYSLPTSHRDNRNTYNGHTNVHQEDPSSSLYHTNPQSKSFQTYDDDNNQGDNNAFMMDSATETRVQDLMKERFGLELPTIRHPSHHTEPDTNKNDKTEEKQNNYPNSTPLPISAQRTNSNKNVATRETTGVTPKALSPQATTTVTQNGMENDIETTDATAGIPLSILEAMPPHIRQVAAKRPDLVRKLLSARVAQSQQQQQKQEQEHEQHQQQALPKTPTLIPSLPIVSEQLGGVEEEEDDDDEGGETVFLLKEKPSTVRRRQQQLQPL